MPESAQELIEALLECDDISRQDAMDLLELLKEFFTDICVGESECIAFLSERGIWVDVPDGDIVAVEVAELRSLMENYRYNPDKFKEQIEALFSDEFGAIF